MNRLLLALFTGALFACSAAAAEPPAYVAPPAYNVTPGFTVKSGQDQRSDLKPYCVCGDDCTCPPDSCPGKCTVDPRKATVYIQGNLGNGVSSGGVGTVIANEGGQLLILTNRHVITTDRLEAVYWWKGDPYRTPVKCVAKTNENEADLALVVMDLHDAEVAKHVPAVEIAESIPEAGAPIHLYGFGGAAADNTVEPIHKTGTVINDRNWVIPTTNHTAYLIEGDSGSGLFDSAGRLVGVNDAYIERFDPVRRQVVRIGGAVRLDAVHHFVVNTLKSKRVLFPRLHDRLAARKIAKAATKALEAVQPPKVQTPAPKAPPKPQPAPKAAPAAAPQPFTIVPGASGGCPGGRCPAPSVSRRGIFGRR